MAYIFDASKGETPESVAQRRRTADALAARIFGRAPQNLGEGLNALGQAWIAASMRDEAAAAQKAGAASGNDAFAQITRMISGVPAASAPVAVTIPPAASVNDPGLSDAITKVSAERGIDPAYLTRTAALESNGDVNAANPNSSARGPFQFIKSTAAQYGLTDPTNPMAATDAAARLALDNKAVLARSLGREPTNAELYLAHQQGAGGASKLLANPDAPVETVIGPEAARLNGAKPGMTAGDFAKKWTGKFGDPATDVSAQRAVRPQQGPDMQTLMQAAANPWLNEGQRAIVQTMLKQRLESDQQAADPLRQLQIKKAERDIADGKSPESVREYEYAKTNGYEGTFQDWIASKRAGAGEYGLNAIWGKGPDGNPAIIQLGKGGKPILTPMPEGFQPNKDAQKVDLGSHWGILDPTTRQMVTTIPKDLRGAEREKGVGEAQGKAVASASQDIQAGQNAIDLLDKIEKHPYLERGTGLSSLANIIPGTGGHDFSNMVEQAKSGAFLQAVQQMRGLGALSNSEGGAATAAITRMTTSTSKEAFVDALNDYRKIITQGMDRAKSRLADPSAINPGATQSAPSVDDLLKKYGG